MALSGNAVITGNLLVSGTTTTINVQNLTIADKDIVVANNVSTSALVDGAGILAGNPTVAYIVYSDAIKGWTTANNFNVGANLTVAGTTTLTGVATAPTAANGTSNTQVATTAFVRNIIPTGVITLWYGSIVNIPNGWLLCDGTNSTPDLRDRFIVGAGSTYAVAATGGATSNTPSGSISGTVGNTALTEAQMPKHYHTLWGPAAISGFVQSPITNAGVFNGGTPDDGAQTYGSYSVGGDAASGGFGTGTSNGNEHGHSFSGSFGGTSMSILPPYYALAYIMKA